MMSPVERARLVPSVLGFDNDLRAHLEPGGIVVSTPDLFCMCRPVDSRAPHEDLANPFMRWPSEACDTCMVWLCVGSLVAAWGLLWDRYGGQEWLAFQTDGPVRFVSAGKVRYLIYGQRRSRPKSKRDAETRS